MRQGHGQDLLPTKSLSPKAPRHTPSVLASTRSACQCSRKPTAHDSTLRSERSLICGLRRSTAQAPVTTSCQVPSNINLDTHVVHKGLHLEEGAVTGPICHRTRQDQPPTVSSIRNLPNREPSPTTAIRSPKRVKREVTVASLKYRLTQVQATTTHSCRRLGLPSPCSEEKQTH